MLWDRVKASANGPWVGRQGVPVSAIVGRLESGESPKKVADELGLDAADLIAALGHFALSSTGDSGPPLVQATPRRPRLVGALGEAAWEPMLPGASRRDRLTLAAGLLQVHDFWDSSHEAAQQADDLGERSISAYWHGIAHRREPDSGNAAYWFRRVGVRHPILGPLAEAARTPLEAYGNPPATARLIDGGIWNPSAFIALCADGHPDPKLAGLAHDLQRVEMTLLLDATAATVLA